jgi:hypothetical protein
MSAFTMAGHFSSYRSMADKSVRLTFDTQEATPQLMADIQNSFQKTCYMAVSPDNFTSDYLKEMENVKVDFDDSTKTPAKRMRGVLYRLWEQSNEGYGVFNDYYNAKMETFIEKLKGQIID